MEVEQNAGKHDSTVLFFVCLAVIALLIGSTLFVGGRVAQGANRVTLSVEDPRPVAQAIVMLEARHGWIITYEDPRYAYAGDIADVTEKVRRDLHKYRAGAAPKVLIPKGGTLTFEYDAPGPPHLPPDPGIVVQQLLSAQAASKNGGKFRMEKGNKIIHVIPANIQDRTGRLVSQQSILETLITLPEKERTGLQTLEALCAAITTAAHTRVVVGTVPSGLFFKYKDKRGAARQKARDALVQLLERTSNGTNLSWQLFYDPGMKMYVLNIHSV